MPPFDWTVRYEVASDDRFRKIVQQGTAAAPAQFAHSVHAEVAGLAPAREYWYRFMVDGEVVPPAARARCPRRMRRSRTSRWPSRVADFRMGQYAAWRHVAASQPDLILFLGDYIYEPAAKAGQVRAYRRRVHHAR